MTNQYPQDPRKEWTPSPEEWQNAKAEIDHFLEKRRRKMAIWWMAGAASLVLLLLGAFFLSDTEQSENTTRNEPIAEVSKASSQANLANPKEYELTKEKTPITPPGTYGVEGSNSPASSSKTSRPEQIASTPSRVDRRNPSRQGTMPEMANVITKTEITHDEESHSSLPSSPSTKQETQEGSWNFKGDRVKVNTNQNPNSPWGPQDSEMPFKRTPSTIAPIMNLPISEITSSNDVTIQDNRPSLAYSTTAVKARLWSWSPTLQLSYLGGSANQVRTHGATTILGLEFIKNNAWGFSLGVGMDFSSGDYGETRRIYADRAGFGANYERWQIFTKSIWNLNTQLGITHYFGENGIRATMTYQKTMGAIANINSTEVNTQASIVDGHTPQSNQLSNRWLNNFGQRTSNWSFGLEYHRNFMKKWTGIVGLRYGLEEGKRWEAQPQRTEVRNFDGPTTSPLTIKLGIQWRI